MPPATACRSPTSRAQPGRRAQRGDRRPVRRCVHRPRRVDRVAYRWAIPTQPEGPPAAPPRRSSMSHPANGARPSPARSPGVGRYNVTLTVTDDRGATNTIYRRISVEPRSPTAVASVTPQRGGPGTVFTFTGSGSTDPDGTIDSYRWVVGGRRDLGRHLLRGRPGGLGPDVPRLHQRADPGHPHRHRRPVAHLHHAHRDRRGPAGAGSRARSPTRGGAARLDGSRRSRRRVRSDPGRDVGAVDRRCDCVHAHRYDRVVRVGLRATRPDPTGSTASRTYRLARQLHRAPHRHRRRRTPVGVARVVNGAG